MKYERLKEGMVLYDVHTYKMGNTKLRSVGVWPVEIVKLRDDGAEVIWNHNPAVFWPRHRLERLRVNKPELVESTTGQRRLKRRGG